MQNYKQGQILMNTTTDDVTTPESTRHPIAYWLKAAERFTAEAFSDAFKANGMSRRDWRMLNRLEGSAQFRSALSGRKLGGLFERGWITKQEGVWTLTDAGRDAKARMDQIASDFQSRVNDTVQADDLATTMRTLEKLAREFGWDEEAPLPRGRERGRGRGPRSDYGGGHEFGRGSGRGFGRHHGRGRGHGHGRSGYRSGFFEGQHHGPGAMDASLHPYERGFNAGFARGREG